MSKFAAVLMVTLAVASGGALVTAEPVTVTGQVVDLLCYDVESKANTGMDHPMGRECASACVKWWGQPVGLLTADGKLYQLAGGLVADNNAKIAPHVTHTVTISGEVSDKDGMLMLTASDLTMVKSPAK